MLFRSRHDPPPVLCDVTHRKEEAGCSEPRAGLYQTHELHGRQLASSAAEAKVFGGLAC
jgi:hypothetical protein